jgi:hypothetical protein
VKNYDRPRDSSIVPTTKETGTGYSNTGTKHSKKTQKKKNNTIGIISKKTGTQSGNTGKNTYGRHTKKRYSISESTGPGREKKMVFLLQKSTTRGRT